MHDGRELIKGRLHATQAKRVWSHLASLVSVCIVVHHRKWMSMATITVISFDSATCISASALLPAKQFHEDMAPYTLTYTEI